MTVAGFLAAVFLGGIPDAGVTQEPEIIEAGKREFQRSCATCHGVDAKGDGPSASVLNVKPADLTQLRKKNKGEFAFWRLYKIIDGRDIVRGHGARNMPVWGAEFLMEEGGGYLDEDRVIGRILGLVYYLQSIQEK